MFEYHTHGLSRPWKQFFDIGKNILSKAFRKFCSLRKIASLAVFDDFTSVVKH